MGDTVFSEYSKITAEDDLMQKVWLRLDGNFMDVSSNHWLLCIEPIIFGIWLGEEHNHVNYQTKTEWGLYFGGSPGKKQINSPETELKLVLFESIPEDTGTLFLLKLTKSKIHHVDFIKRYLIFFRYYRRDGLSYRRFKAFVSAYSYPRRIRLVSFRQDSYYNIFPMDLVGDISQRQRYVFGLRHTNVALSKIIETGKLAIAEVPHQYSNLIYQLGKHHSGNPPPVNTLDFDIISTRNFSFHFPAWVESYKELRILRTLNMGSHMLLWSEVTESETLTNSSEHLYLVHFLHYLEQKNAGRKYTLV